MQLLPVGLVILCIVSFKTCYFAEMFDWTTHTGYLYLPSWVREIGAMLQLLPILLVPFVAIIQTCRYFLNGSDELFEVLLPQTVLLFCMFTTQKECMTKAQLDLTV